MAAASTSSLHETSTLLAEMAHLDRPRASRGITVLVAKKAGAAQRPSR